MDHSAVVGMAQRAADIDDEADYLAPIEAPAAADFFLQAVAVDQFHGIENSCIIFAEAEEFDDVRVVEFAEGFDFGLEPAAKALLLGQGGGQEFDCGGFARFEIDAFENGAHPAPPELAHDLIRSEPFDLHVKSSRLPDIYILSRQDMGRHREGQ